MRISIQVVLVVFSAAMLPLCFAPFGWWLLLFFVYVPLFYATSSTTPRRAFYLGMLQGILGYGITLWWFFLIFGAAAISLFALLGLFIALFCLLQNIFTKQTKSVVLKVLLTAMLWTAIEFYRSELFFLRFPWITPGTALGPTYLSPILGVYSTSFLVIAACAGFVQRRTVPLAFFLSLCVICLGLFRPGRIEPDTENSITVTVVQSEECVLETYVELTRSAKGESPELIVWPEYSLPYDVRDSEDQLTLLENLCAEMDAVLVLGTKTVVGSGGKDWYNTALILDEQGVVGEYYKARPVHFFNDGMPGHKFEPIRTDLGALATPICFDCDYSEVARKMVRLGAEFFAVPSFDAESWSVSQHLQHAFLFRLRAAENGRWLACAASSGVSQIIDPHGNVHRSLPPMETGVVTYPVSRSNQMTVFVRAGWLFPWSILFCSAILLAIGAIRFIAQKREEAQLAKQSVGVSKVKRKKSKKVRSEK